jgi:hypothetical protein
MGFLDRNFVVAPLALTLKGYYYATGEARVIRRLHN